MRTEPEEPRGQESDQRRAVVIAEVDGPSLHPVFLSHEP